MTRALACGIVALALTGCGTVQNFVDLPEFEASERGKLRTKPYGGVRIAAKRFQADLVELALLWPLWTTDVVLSAVGDTLTLPVTLPIAGMHAIHDSFCDYYFPAKRTESAQLPDPPVDRPPDPMPTERVP